MSALGNLGDECVRTLLCQQSLLKVIIVPRFLLTWVVDWRRSAGEKRR